VSGGYRPGSPPTDLAFLIERLAKIDGRLDTLERPSGEQLAQIVEELTAWVTDIQSQLDDYLANDAYTKAQVDALVASPGNISPGMINAGGVATLNPGIVSSDVKTRVLSVSYDSVYIDGFNRMGLSPSARRFKQDETDHDFDPSIVDAMQGKRFRLIAAVEAYGDEAPYELGYIADDLEKIGLGDFVRRDGEGEIAGLAYERIVIVAVDAIKALRREHAELADRIAQLETKTSG
jgi:uncharacterized coiled-coil protein SlyX